MPVTDDSNEPNGRVTTRQFYEALLKQNERMDAISQRQSERVDQLERRLLSAMQDITRTEPIRLVQQINTIEKSLDQEERERKEEDKCLQDDIDDLRIKSSRWDKALVAVTTITSTIAAIIGVNR